MNCKQVKDNLSPYLDQVLSQEEIVAVKKHLAKCQLCRQELEDVKRTLNIIQTLPDIPLPFGFQQELRTKLTAIKEERERQEGKSWLGAFRSFKYSWAPLGMAALLLIFLYALMPPSLPKNLVLSDIPYPGIVRNETVLSQIPDGADALQDSMLQGVEKTGAEDAGNGPEPERDESSFPQGESVIIPLAGEGNNQDGNDQASTETNSAENPEANEISDMTSEEMSKEWAEASRGIYKVKEESGAPIYRMAASSPEEIIDLGEEESLGQKEEFQLNIGMDEYEDIFNKISGLSGKLTDVVIDVDYRVIDGKEEEGFIITVVKDAIPKVMSEINNMEQSVGGDVYNGSIPPEKSESLAIKIVIQEIE